MTTITQHFYNSKVHESIQARLTENFFEIELEPIHQGVGVVGDYTVIKNSEKFSTLFPNITIIEFKNDKSSVVYNSFYCEYEQTKDGWYTCNPSGHLKAIQANCLLVIQSGREFFCFDKETFMSLFEQATVEKTSRMNIYGNHNGCYTRARILYKKYCTDVFKFNIETEAIF